MPSQPLRLTRDQLAKFLPDHETIKQFERLLALVQEFDQTTLDQIEIEAGNAVATANNALTIIESLRYWKRIAGILSPVNSGDGLTVDGLTSLDITTMSGLLTQYARRGTPLTVSTTSTLTQTGTDWEVDTSGITVSAWASPSTGDKILVYASFSTGSFTMSGNGNNIDGASSLTIYAGETFEWFYNGTEWLS